MRSTKMVELLGGDPEGVVISLNHLLRRSGGPTDPHAEALDALVIATGANRLAYEVRSVIYATALGRADAVVSRLFLSGQRERGDTDDIEKNAGEARALIPQGKAMTLGERKSLARGKRDDRLLHLLRDPHPVVISILLGNPHLIEADVLTVASRRPTLAATQEHILASDKWRARYRVKRALVFNPYSPPSIGVRLVCCMSDTDLRATAADPNLASLVRQQATGLLALRRDR